jgi:DNA polymerase-1|tara:strand:- start:386 stop:1114 length:729 start_codon:yes stop_codon:yes gene_type:complete
MKKAIIDGDMFLYKSAFSSEVETRWDDDVWTLHTDLNQAKLDIEQSFSAILSTLGVDDMVVALSDSDNFRKDFFPEYKANRNNLRKPLGIKGLRQWIQKSYPHLILERLEADDVCGILCTLHPDYVAVSGDKDFGTLPITWFNHLTQELKTITKAEADFFHKIQTLTGDATDGYNGLPGFGPKTAQKLLHKEGCSWETVVGAYEKKGFTEEDALTTARLAYILREENYNNGEIKLWEPQATN